MTGPVLLLSKAPTDPEQYKEWVKHWVRVQVAMWVDDGAKCAYCETPYSSVDDLLNRKPKRGWKQDQFVDDNCWVAYILGFKGKQE